MKPLIVLVLIGISCNISAGNLKVGLFSGKDIESVVVSVVEGEYTITGNGMIIDKVGNQSIYQVEILNSQIRVHGADASYGPFQQVAFIPSGLNCVFMVRPVFPASLAKESDDRLDLNSVNGFLRIINTIDMEKYLAGTVESEGGSLALPEYYKAQAVLVRTFAIRNYYRHAHEGFNLCDDVHCQAYNGKSHMNKDIYLAVNQTRALILTDGSGEPVMTAYHSSCGGMTANAAVEWNRDLEYLYQVADPFCNKSKNMNWSKSIPVQEWNAYLARTGYTGDMEKLSSGESGRLKYLDTTDHKIPLTEIRRQFNLKSSWFHITNHGDQIIVTGHGYGHGLGLCQEGAIEMARVGYTYVDILMFYFKGLELENRL